MASPPALDFLLGGMLVVVGGCVFEFVGELMLCVVIVGVGEEVSKADDDRRRSCEKGAVSKVI